MSGGTQPGTPVSDFVAGTADRPRLPQALGNRIDVFPVVESLRPLILESEPAMERDGELPSELVEALYDAGVFHTMHPREFGGLELHPLDYLELVFQLARINGSVSWISVIQNGSAPLLAPELMHELYASASGRWIVSGSHGRIGKAYPADGGYRFTGDWAFASGSPWATYITAYAHVMGEDGRPLRDPFTGGPLYVDGIFPRAAVDYIGGWNSLGLRGSGSGRFSLDDVFVERRFTTQGMPHQAYMDRAIFRAGSADDSAVAMVLGCAQGAIDKFIELSNRPARTNSWANRASSLGSEQSHQMGIAHADALIRSARHWLWDLAERRYEDAFSKDGPSRYELMVQTFQANIYAGRVAKEAVNLIFDIAGTDSVIVGRGIERCFRDVHTATQHTLMLANNYVVPGQYYLTRDREDGPRIDAPNSLLPPPPRTGRAARVWRLDRLHSTVGFRVTHHAVSTFRGEFGEFDAEYDPFEARLVGSVQARSLDVAESVRERLLSDSFLAADRFPSITFESSTVKVDQDAITVEGDLTLRGVSKAIKADGKLSGPSKVEGWDGPDNEHIGLDFEVPIDRRNFGVDANNVLLDGQLNLGWIVTLEFSLEFSRPVLEVG